MNLDIKQIFVRRDQAISEAVRVLNDGHMRIALVVDPNTGGLEGVVADPDIRRAILNGVAFSEPVHKIMVSKPVVATLEMSDAEVLALMQEKGINEIPVIDSKGRAVDLKIISKMLQSRPALEAVIMAGGLGTRLMPLTADIPKPLMKVGDRAILFILIDQLIRAGCQRITLALNYRSEQIKAAIREVPEYQKVVHFVEETKRMGTAGSLSLLKTRPAGPFFVLNADLLTRVDFNAMLEFHKKEGNRLTLAIKEERQEMPFGVVKLQGSRVMELEEKPVQSFFVNAGIYVLEPSALDSVELDTFFNMTDLIDCLLRDSEQVGSFPVHEYWRDIGRHDDLERVQREAKELEWKN